MFNSPELINTEIDLDVIKTVTGSPMYSFKVAKKDGKNFQSTTLTWGHILNSKDDDTAGTLQKVSELSPKMTFDLINEIKEDMKVYTLDHTKLGITKEQLEIQVDNSINKIKGDKDNPALGTPITSPDYYDLLDLISI